MLDVNIVKLKRYWAVRLLTSEIVGYVTTLGDLLHATKRQYETNKHGGIVWPRSSILVCFTLCHFAA